MTLPSGPSEPRSRGDLPPLSAWAKTLQRRIRQRGLDFFILYGPGVRDLHPLGARRFGTMGEFLSEVILGGRSAIVTYDRRAGATATCTSPKRTGSGSFSWVCSNPSTTSRTGAGRWARCSASPPRGRRRCCTAGTRMAGSCWWARCTLRLPAPPSTSWTAVSRSALGLGPLVGVMVFTGRGGPCGLEGLVGWVGPGVAVLLLVTPPLIYSIPETLLIGELASMLPAEGGYYQWVKRAFGRFWGFWNGWLSWVYSLIDMAIYPVLFLQYLRFFVPGLGPWQAWLVALALIWGATWLNLRGTRVVGMASGWFVALVLAPFGVLATVALARWLGQPATPR